MNFLTIYNTYWQKIFRVCMGYVNDTEKAKDLTQETFIIVLQKQKDFREDAAISTWIFKIATNQCLGFLRKEKRFTRAPLPKNLPNNKEEVSMDSNPKVKQLYGFIASLPKIDRIIISLELEEIPQAEIARIVGISPSNVRVKIHRIKNKLLKKFNSHE